MFGWFRKKRDPAPRPQLLRPIPPPPPPVTSIRRPAPPPQPTARAAPPKPGHATLIRVNFNNGREQWTEEVDLIDLLARVLAKHGYACRAREDGWLEIGDTRISVLPKFEDGNALEGFGTRTCTTIRSRHSAVFPNGVFEYQHSTGANVANSIGKGFEHWVVGDLIVLINTLGEKPAGCMFMDMEFPATATAPARHRRVVCGPVAHFRQHPPADLDKLPKEQKAAHDFCPCCFFDKSIDAFKSLIETDDFAAVRMYAMRDPKNGQVAADCRINGEEYEVGKAALRRYVGTWPEAGFEFRKQYVVFQSLPIRAAAGPQQAT